MTILVPVHLGRKLFALRAIENFPGTPNPTGYLRNKTIIPIFALKRQNMLRGVPEAKSSYPVTSSHEGFHV